VALPEEDYQVFWNLKTWCGCRIDERSGGILSVVLTFVQEPATHAAHIRVASLTGTIGFEQPQLGACYAEPC
jgi:hypothetical protein